MLLLWGSVSQVGADAWAGTLRRAGDSLEPSLPEAPVVWGWRNQWSCLPHCPRAGAVMGPHPTAPPAPQLDSRPLGTAWLLAKC